MLSSLRIQGFRGFADYRVERLARVNLFVGTNNSGKTSVLEAAETLLGGGDLRVVVAGPLRREEGIFDRDQAPEALELAHLFHGRPSGLPAAFTISGRNGAGSSVEVTLHTQSSEQRALWAGEQPPGLRLSLSTRILHDAGNRPETRVIAVDELVELLGRRRLRSIARRSLSPSSQLDPLNFIPTAGLGSQALAERWNRLALTPQEGLVVQALQVIEPHTERLAFLQDPAQIPQIMVKMDNSPTPVPLGSMGEGVRRMLALAIGLGTSASGSLLIDEIDTGLHHGAMARMWKLVIEGARLLDVQVLATTHSLDCIRALADFAAEATELRDDVLVHRIEAQRDRAITFTADEVCTAVRNESELRGWLR